MSVSGVAGSNPAYQPYASGRCQQHRQAMQDIKAMMSDVASGDLSGAKKALADLQQVTGKSANDSAQQGSADGNSLRSDFSALIAAIQDGSDPTAAKNALAKLQQDMQAAGMDGHSHHHQIRQGQSDAAMAAYSQTAAGGVDADGDNDGSKTPILSIAA